ncbi:MAG: hypothetical protein IPP31_08940 [Chitinophagaceae bacterium]|nr:hypothetical protein [Chitinophagaceae bacterium]
MKRILFFMLSASLTGQLNAQSNQSSLIEGGKLLVELVKVFKKEGPAKTGSDQLNGKSDLCFSNTTRDTLSVEVFKKLNDTVYRSLPFSLNLSGVTQECLLELNPMVYHYRISKRSNGLPQTLVEGDLRLMPNEKMQREIK